MSSDNSTVAVLERPTPVEHDARPAVAGPGDATQGHGPWTGFGVVLAAMILNILDSTIVNVAAPAIRGDLGMSESSLEWIAAAYTLALAVGLMTGGRLGDMFGRRRMLLTGLTGFVLASIACSFAWSSEVLVMARVLQGLSAALITPQGFGLIRDLFGPQRIGKAFAALGPVIGLSTVLGPVVAGLLMDANVFGTGWRALFLINVPVGVAAIVVGRRALPAAAPRPEGLRADPVGTVLLAVVAFLIVFPLVDGRTNGWPTWIFAMLAAAVPVLAGFVWHQRSRIRARRSPMVEPSVFGKRSYVSGALFVLVFFGVIVGLSLTIGLFLQMGLGFSPLKASLYLAALAVGAFLGSGVGAWAATAVGRPILHVGLTIMAVGTLVLWLTLRGAHGVDIGVADLAPGLAVFGLGMGMIFVPLFSIVIGDIEDHEVGSASGLLESLQQLGASLGIAVLTTMFVSVFDIGRGGPQAAIAAGRHLMAAEHTLLAVLGAIGLAFAIGWLLPRRAREMG